MKKISLPVYFFLVINLFSQNAILDLNERLDEILSDNLFSGSVAAIEIYNLSTDKPVYSKNSKLLLRPASNLKILTSLAALYYLDSNYTFNTSLFYEGNIRDSVLLGNIFIAGGGDPEFFVKDMDSLVHQLKDSGIKSIKGNLYGDISMFDSVYWGQGWMWDDNPFSFSPYLSPLIVNKSSYKIYFSPGEIGESANVNIIPESGFYSIINNSVTVQGDSGRLKITRDWIRDKNDIIIDGTIPEKTGPDSVFRNISRPNDFFLTLFKEKMIQNGIEVEGVIDTLSLPDNVIHLCTFSHPLDTVLHKLNKESDNLNAEMVLRALGNTYFGKRCSAEDGSNMIDSLIILVGLNPKNYRHVDGSGLSFYNLVTAELLMQVMRYTYRNNKKLFNRFYETLPVAGIDGTLKERFLTGGCKNNLRAKTGTLSGISSLSGLVKSKSGDDILFSIMIQNYVVHGYFARRIQNKICNIIFEEL